MCSLSPLLSFGHLLVGFLWCSLEDSCMMQDIGLYFRGLCIMTGLDCMQQFLLIFRIKTGGKYTIVIMSIQMKKGKIRIWILFFIIFPKSNTNAVLLWQNYSRGIRHTF